MRDDLQRHVRDLSSPDSTAWRAALLEIQELGAAAVEAVPELLRDPGRPPDYWMRIPPLIAAMGGGAVPFLRDVLRAPGDAYSRETACNALRQLGAAAAPAIPELAEAFLHGGALDHYAAGNALAGAGAAGVAELAKALGEGEPARSTAAHYLRTAAGEEGLQALRAALGDARPGARAAAARALLEAGQDDAAGAAADRAAAEAALDACVRERADALAGRIAAAGDAAALDAAAEEALALAGWLPESSAAGAAGLRQVGEVLARRAGSAPAGPAEAALAEIRRWLADHPERPR
jgi:hypothetical protein